MPSTKMRTFQPFNVGIERNFVALAAVFEGRSLMHRTLHLPWRAPRKRTKLPGGEQISKSGGLFAQGSNPVGRRQAQFLAEIRERALSKIRKTDQCLVLTHLANGFQVGCSESVLDPGGKQ